MPGTSNFGENETMTFEGNLKNVLLALSGLIFVRRSTILYNSLLTSRESIVSTIYMYDDVHSCMFTTAAVSGSVHVAFLQSLFTRRCGWMILLLLLILS
jgi:hypothetical protein